MPSQSLTVCLSLTQFQTRVVAEAQVFDLALQDYQCPCQHLGVCWYHLPHVWAADSEVVKRHAAKTLP